MSSRHLHLTKFRGRSLLDRLATISLTGVGPSSLSCLPDDRQHHGMETETVALLPVLRRLEVVVGGSGAANSLSGLRLLLEHLSLSQSQVPSAMMATDDIEGGQNPPPLSEKIGERFVAEGGLQIVLTLLLAGTGNLENNPRPTSETSVKLRQLCLDVLCQLCLLNKTAPEFLGETDELLIFCFHQLNHPTLYEKACYMIEQILMARRTTLNLCEIPHLQKILTRLEGGRLASFCKLLAVTVSDLDIFENKSSLYQQNIQKRSNSFIPVRDINQELVLSVPGFLSRLVEHASRLPYNPRFASTPAEIDHWMRFIDDHISDEIAVGEPLLIESYPGGGLTDPCSSLVNDLVDRVEVLYVLGLLLVGKHRKQVQRELAELQLIPKLSNLFDNFIWRSNGGRQRTRLPGHYPGCECSPEVALKIQFLRLVHSFCDHSDYKHLLMSRCEWDELGRIPPSPSPATIKPLGPGTMLEPEPSPPPPTPDSRLMCRGTHGLLTKIVEVLKKEPTSSTFRFWLCRAVESYLRGGTSYADQIFLLRRGLLQHITASLIQTEVRQKETIQSSFDLLGEMVKFNYDACKQMDSILNSESKLKKGMIMVNNNLIDSNMFIRAMVLACDHFIQAGGEAAEFASNSRLMKHFREFEKHVQFVVQLVSILNVTELTQENVSCLNTSLVILMLSARRSRLADMITSLLDYGDNDPSGFRAGKTLLKNLKHLLKFWQEHYLHKDKDCSTLEKSSLIPFTFWKDTVDQLVSDDTTSPTAIIHYIKDMQAAPFSRPQPVLGALGGPQGDLMDTDDPL